jgi:hypothetical protein
MAEPPPPPFETQLSEQAQDTLAGEPALAASANAIVLRAAKELRRQLDMGQNLATDVHGKREQLTVRVSMIPPDTLRIEDVAPGDVAPEGALLV